ncbi:MAG: outer membrane lipoprotein-sorting protein, partial [Pyrinomonadaceae bacterium]
VLASCWLACIFGGYAGLALAKPGVSPDAETLLRESDRARGGNVDGIVIESTVSSFHDADAGKVYSIRVYSDVDNSLVTFLQPEYSVGIKFLMQGRNMWLMSRETKKPVPISPRQRLVGDASNGDVATTNYVRDYDGKTLGEDQVNGEPCYKLELTAKQSNVTYDKIVYYISKKNHLGLKAEYYTVSGRHFKTAYFQYGNRLLLDTGTFPFMSRMEILDEVEKGERTELLYNAPEIKRLSPSMFDRNSLSGN